VDTDQEPGRVPSRSSQHDYRAVAVLVNRPLRSTRCHGCVRTGLVRQIVVRGCQVIARAFAFSWSNSAWVIVPASRSCLADAI
jgi:hypothetical protein